MQRRKARVSRWATEFLFVAGIYTTLLLIGWLVARWELAPALHTPSGQGQQTSSSMKGRTLETGRLIVLSPNHCQIGEFSNIRPNQFEVTETNCNQVVGATGNMPSDGGRGSRMETIGRYFRGQK